MYTSHVCAHRMLQRVPLNTRYTFKQSSMLNGVGMNCSYVAMCTCRCVHRTIKRSCEARYTKPAALEASAAHKCGPVTRSLLHWKQVLRTNAASSAKQLSAQVLCTSAVHKCCAQVLRSCANIYCLPFCAHHLSFFLSFFHFSSHVPRSTCPIYMSFFFTARARARLPRVVH